VLRTLGRDAALAVRLLARSPGFAAVALVTLALGIGAPTAIFSVVHAVLLRPLTYPEPDRVVRFRIESSSPAGPVSFDALPATMALSWARQSHTLSEMALFDDRALTLTTGDGPVRLSGISATPSLFSVLRVMPTHGRTFKQQTPDPHEIILSHRTWARYFASSPAVIDSVVTMDGEPYRVVGIMPDAFTFPDAEAAFWVPLLLGAGEGRGMLVPAIARLSNGATVEAVVAEGRPQLDDDSRFPQTLSAHTLQDQMVGGVRRILWILLAAVGFVLVIATANIALLLMTRGANREREFSIRLALGAGRGRLVRQLFAEGLTLGAIGGIAGLGVAWLGLQLFRGLAPADIPRLQDASLNGQVLTFAIALTGLTSLVFGVLSAGRTLTVDPIRALGGAAAESRLVVTGGLPRRRLKGLAAAELALTMVLLLGAGLLLRSFTQLVLLDQGFESRGALAAQINLPRARYSDAAVRMAFLDRLLEHLHQLPGATVAGVTTTMPNRQPSGRFGFSSASDAFPPADPFSIPTAAVHMVSEGFIEAVGLHLRAGRTFSATDAPGAERVVIISDQLAQKQFSGRNPIGEWLYSGTGNRRVVGVVSNVRPAASGEEPQPTAYLPLRQNTDILQWFGTITMVLRGAQPQSLAAPARTLVLSLDSAMPTFNVRGLEDEVAELVAGPRFAASLLALFALVALVMASVGVYGVMAYSTRLRTREIAVRMALGSTRAQVLRLLLRDGAVVVGVGLVAGTVAALWLARTLTGLLHEVTPADPLALVSVAAVLALSGLIAVLIPAARATRLNALDALREE
jgi:putative ABC transport system permease protein